MTRSRIRWALAGCMAPAALAAVALDIGPRADAASGEIVSTVTDPVDDHIFKFDVPFQDFVRAQLTKTESGDFEFLMELAGAVPAEPPLTRHGRSEIWWFWVLDLDPTAQPEGYPWNEAAEAANDNGNTPGRRPEFMVCVSWDGSEFAGFAIDRRPLLAGGEAVVTPVPFRIDGTIVEAFLDADVIGAVPTSFTWGPSTADWAGPVGTEGFNFADYFGTGAVFNP